MTNNQEQIIESLKSQLVLENETSLNSMNASAIWNKYGLLAKGHSKSKKNILIDVLLKSVAERKAVLITASEEYFKSL